MSSIQILAGIFLLACIALVIALQFVDYDATDFADWEWGW